MSFLLPSFPSFLSSLFHHSVISFLLPHFFSSCHYSLISSFPSFLSSLLPSLLPLCFSSFLLSLFTFSFLSFFPSLSFLTSFIPFFDYGSRQDLQSFHLVSPSRRFTTSEITVRLGEYTFDSKTDSTHTDFAVASAKIHEGYEEVNYHNDIAILTLERSTAFSDEVWPVCLPAGDENYLGRQGTVIGEFCARTRRAKIELQESAYSHGA